MHSYVKAEVCFFSYEDGGRPIVPIGDGYAPYIRVPKIMKQDLAVRIYRMPQNSKSGEFYNVEIELCYHPKVDYSALDKNVEFELIEGIKIVGKGIVLSEIYEK